MKHSRGKTGTFRRVIKQASLCLLLGAIVNVAVAWGCAMFMNVQNGVKTEALRKPAKYKEWWQEWWKIEKHESFGSLRLHSMLLGSASHRKYGEPRQLVPEWALKYVDPSGNNWDRKKNSESIDARGWPLLSLVCIFDVKENSVRPFRVDTDNGIPFAWTKSETTFSIDSQGSLIPVYYPQIIPLTPIWPHFLINSIFYGTVCFFLGKGFKYTKLNIRKKTGHCPLCKYNLRGNLESGCPECGWNRQEDRS